jgi:hypothetical protein
MKVDLWELVTSLPAEAGDVEFARCWSAVGELVGERADVGQVAMLEVMRDAGSLQSGSMHPAWGGGWRWNMSSAAAKSVLASGIVYGVLVAAGVPALLPLVVPAVIPLLFDIEKVRLTPAEGRVINIIGARNSALTRSGTPRQLYETLPDDVRQSLSEAEFEEFIDKAIAAGVASGYGDVVEVLSTGESVFRLQIT